MPISKKLLAVILLMLSLTGTGSAKELNAWRDCGIGAMIFSDVPVGAIISNLIWDLGTTALTSAATSRDQCKGKEVAAAKFITETYANLEEQTVKGSGQHLNAMLDILGCDADAHAPIISSVRAEFGNTLQQSNYTSLPSIAKAENYYNLVQAAIKNGHTQQCGAS